MNYAVTSDVEKLPSVQMHVDPRNRGHTSIMNLPNGNPNWDQSVEIPTITIDLIYDAYKDDMCQVGTMKIDVEGYEGHVLLGSKRFLNECPPCCIFMEVNGPWLEQAGTPVHEVWEFLRQNGYNGRDHTGDDEDYMFTYKDESCSCARSNW